MWEGVSEDGGGGGREREHGLDPSAVELICVTPPLICYLGDFLEEGGSRRNMEGRKLSLSMRK